ncbi:hypothetical protein CR513_12264, partial [Mucuna pruriens]
MERSMIDAASREALMDKTPAITRHLISNMASNTQQFGVRGPSQSRIVNEIDTAANQRLENQLTELSSLVRQLAVGQHQPVIAAKVCGICTFVEHPADMCPTLQETESDQTENVGAIGGFQYGKQPYQTQPFDNQQYGRQPYRPGTNQGSYATQRFRPAPNAPQGVVVSVEHDRHHSRPQNANRTVSQHCEPFTVSRIKQPSLSNYSKSERECKCSDTKKWKTLPQPALQRVSRSVEADSEPDADSPSRQDKTILVPFPTWTISARKPKSDEELLKMF